MPVKILSDVHGEFDALAGQLDPGDTAVMLGDYVNLIDFHTLDGILARVYSREAIRSALAEFAKGNPHAARRKVSEIVGASPEQYSRVVELVAESYRELFGAIPCRAYLIYGNTDNPHLMRELATDGVEVIDSGVREINGRVFGFVSGSPQGPWTVGLPGEMRRDEYERRIAELGRVDVLCTHYPPAVPELTWDVLAERDEAGSEALLSYLDEHLPAFHYFGHVHNPREESGVRGGTRLVNAGYFKKHHKALLHGGGQTTLRAC